MAKPVEVTDWATSGSALKTATDSSRWTLGWQTLPGNQPSDTGERPNLNQQNYWQNAVHTWIQYLDETVDAAIANYFAVGSVQQSMLSEVQFQNELGTTWVIMDGRNVAGSRYEAITGNSNIPNAFGRFFRMTGGAQAAPLGQAQAEGTAVNGLTNQSSGVSGTAAGQGGGATTSGGRSNAHTHTIPTILSGDVFQAGTGRQAYGSGAGLSTAGETTDHSHSVPAHTHSSSSVSGTASAQFMTGDGETRPVNIAFNYFIKIDN